MESVRGDGRGVVEERVNKGGKIDKDGGVARRDFAHGARSVGCHGDGNLQGFGNGE